MSPPEGRDADALVVYYSRTGTTQAVGTTVARELASVTVEQIRPTTERGYWNWLARSLRPGSRVDIEPPDHRPTEFDAVFVGTPKWSASCPPVTEYIERVPLDGCVVGLFVTYGGFDERRYAHSIRRRLQRAGATVPALLLVQRDRTTSVPADAVRRFRDVVLAETAQRGTG